MSIYLIPSHGEFFVLLPSTTSYGIVQHRLSAVFCFAPCHTIESLSSIRLNTDYQWRHQQCFSTLEENFISHRGYTHALPAVAQMLGICLLPHARTSLQRHHSVRPSPTVWPKSLLLRTILLLSMIDGHQTESSHETWDSLYCSSRISCKSTLAIQFFAL